MSRGQRITGPVVWIVEGGETVGVLAETGSASQGGQAKDSSNSTFTGIGTPPQSTGIAGAPPITPTNIVTTQQFITRTQFSAVPLKVLSNGLYTSGDVDTYFSGGAWLNAVDGVPGVPGVPEHWAITDLGLLFGENITSYDPLVYTSTKTLPFNVLAGNRTYVSINAVTGVPTVRIAITVTRVAAPSLPTEPAAGSVTVYDAAINPLATIVAVDGNLDIPSGLFGGNRYFDFGSFDWITYHSNSPDVNTVNTSSVFVAGSPAIPEVLANIGTVLVLNTQDTAAHTWADFYPHTFSCTFTEDTVIAYLDLRDANLNQICRILNVVSGVTYDIAVDRPIHQLYFVPDALLTEKKLSISNITFDNVTIRNLVDSAASPDLDQAGIFINSDGTEADNINVSGVYFDDGVMYGLTGLAVDSLRFYRVMLNGRVIAYVLSNTATTATTSLTGYTDATPRNYAFSPNIGRMPLAFGAVAENVITYVEKVLIEDASISEYTAPPLPFETDAAMTEHTSASAVTTFASNTKQRMGIMQELI